MNEKNNYNLNIRETLERFETRITGLNDNEIKAKIDKYGINELPKQLQDSFFKILIKQLIDPILLILLVAVIFSFLIGENVDAIAIIFIIIIDLFVGAIQEKRALKTAASLENMIDVKVNVLRNGKEIQIDSKELTIGDVVLLTSGDKISADLRIIESNNMTIDESILTGESINVSKHADSISGSVILAERKNMLYSGTSVISGRGKGVVIAIGISTELGKIADQVSKTKETKSPLTIRMEKFSRQISAFVVIIAIIIAITLINKNTPMSEVFLTVIALSVSAMPEGLPLALTMALTITSNRMSKKNIIVKKLNSVESLGSCTVIATDKTGTLTKNEQTAKLILLPDDSKFEISGSGYNGEGRITSSTKSSLSLINDIVISGYVNNEGVLAYENNKWNNLGDSIDIAFLSLFYKSKIKCNPKIIKIIPYESEKKYSAVIYELDKKIYCTVKGSIEEVMNFSSKMIYKNKIEKIDNEKLLLQNQKMAGAGFRVIALASAEIKSKNMDMDIEKIKELNFLGLVGFVDPVREEVIPAVKECNEAGIKVVMITGDHPLTAYAIGHELKIINNYDELASGEDIERELSLGKESFDKYIKTKKVFARVTPTDKLEIVESYKRQGEFVAVTGDGVNDAPALKTANIGIAMGSGTDVARETANMIVVDDNFTSIVLGIKEGRTAYSNIRKISYMLLSCGVAEIIFMLLAIILNLPIPLVAIQLLWLNIVTDGLQDMALSFEKSEENIMKEGPRNPRENIFNKSLIGEVIVSGLSIGLIVFLLWLYLIKGVGMDTFMARGYVMALMVFMQNMHVLNCRSEKSSIFKNKSKNLFIIFSIILAIVLQIIIMEVPVLSKFLQTSSIPIMDLLILFLLSTLIIPIMECYKYIRRKVKSDC